MFMRIERQSRNGISCGSLARRELHHGGVLLIDVELYPGTEWVSEHGIV
jgi:hypothetical protein